MADVKIIEVYVESVGETKTLGQAEQQIAKYIAEGYEVISSSACAMSHMRGVAPYVQYLLVRK